MTVHQTPPSLIDDTTVPHLSLPTVRCGRLYRRYGKRFLDLVLVLILSIPVLAIIAVLATLVARDGAAPFYSQERLGRGGQRFRLWKLRSMVPDADKKLDDYLQHNPVAQAEWNHTQKLRHDPRVTKIGRFIRRSSMDELPQLFNVLRGDMSLVGPRPMMVDQRALYPGAAYYELRPGITGYWQISARNDSSFSARALYDTSYYEDLTFKTDILVLLRTVRVVLRGTGY